MGRLGEILKLKINCFQNREVMNIKEEPGGLKEPIGQSDDS